MFWNENANEDIKNDNKDLFMSLDKVDWKMNLICPDSGFKTIKIDCEETIIQSYQSSFR